jgi:hypothetical protein
MLPRLNRVGLDDDRREADVRARLVLLAGGPEDGCPRRDRLFIAVAAARPSVPLHDNEQLIARRGMPRQEPTWAEPDADDMSRLARGERADVRRRPDRLRRRRVEVEDPQVADLVTAAASTSSCAAENCSDVRRMCECLQRL